MSDHRSNHREWRRTLGLVGGVGLGLCFLTGYLPARRDVRTLRVVEVSLRDDIRQLRHVTDRLRREIRAARDDPTYAEAMRRARAGGRLPEEPAAPEGWRVPAEGGVR